MSSTYHILLTRGMSAIVDGIDVERVSAFSWVASKNNDGRWYAKARVMGRLVYLHRFICNAGHGAVVDHVNGDALDNRRTNLRICTQSQNCMNTKKRRGGTSLYKGVCLVSGRKTKPWKMTYRANGRQNYVFFDTETEAAQAYDTAAKQFFGHFARLNFSNDQSNVPPVSETYKQESFLCGTNRSDSETRATE